MPINNQIDPEEAELVIDAFYQAYKQGEGGLKHVPGLLLRIINEGLWKRRKIKTGEIVEFDNFKDFVTTEPPEGLGENVDMLKNLCRDHEEAKLALDRVTSKEQPTNSDAGKKGGRGNKAPDNVSGFNESYGNSADYLLSRLKRDAPEVAEDYFNGEYKSVRAAAKAAGIVRDPSPCEKAAKEIDKITDHLELQDLLARIQAKLNE